MMITPINYLPRFPRQSSDPAYKPEDLILVSCGSITLKQKSPIDGQIWTGDDENTSLAPYFKDQAVTNRAYDVTKNTAPYYYARIISSKFTYFMPHPISGGQKIIRLYFYPSTYYNSLDPAQKFNARDSFFDVTANNYTLLSNFSPFAAVKGGKPATNSPYHVKEFIINIPINSLEVTFVPSPGWNRSRFHAGESLHGQPRPDPEQEEARIRE